MDGTVTSLTIDAGVAVVTLERPEVHNSFNTAMADELVAIAARLAADRSVGAVVITGAGGKAFCAGADIAIRRARFAGSVPRLHPAPREGGGGGQRCRRSSSPRSRVLPSAAGANWRWPATSASRRQACAVRSARGEAGVDARPRWHAAGAPRLLPRSVALRLLITGDPIGADEGHRLGFCEQPVEPAPCSQRHSVWRTRSQQGPRGDRRRQAPRRRRCGADVDRCARARAAGRQRPVRHHQRPRRRDGLPRKAPRSISVSDTDRREM